jgi:regulator of protease activity HflC (stomatin/prohibitin superfamily)
MGFLIFLLVIVFIVVAAGVRVIKQYERGVVFRLGKVHGVKEPGLRLILPFVDQLHKVPMRTITLPIEGQKIITKDNVSIDVAAVAYYQIADPVKSIVEIENVVSAIYQIALLNTAVMKILDVATEKWGVYVSNVELKDIQLPESMQRAMAKEAEAEREKRAKIIAAEGEQLSAAKLGAAADIISAHPIALQLRNLQVLSEIAVEKNSTIIFPAQFMDTVDSVKSFMTKEMIK